MGGTLTITCEHCGKVFESKRKKRFCSRHCAYRHRYEGKGARQYSDTYIPVKRESKVCLYCSHEFKPESNGQLYCSPKCQRHDWWKKNRCKEKHCVICGKIIEGDKTNGKKYCSDECRNKAHTKICEECGKEFISRCDEKYCSPECASKAQSDKTLYVCKQCGKTFHRRKRGEDKCEFCSRECAIEYKCKEIYKLTKEDRIVSYSKRRQYRIFRNGKSDHDISLKKLYKHDHGICAICGKPVNMEADTNSDDYGSIDHIIPLSKGGTHTWGNVQLTHRICNSLKCDKTDECNVLYLMVK